LAKGLDPQPGCRQEPKAVVLPGQQQTLRFVQQGQRLGWSLDEQQRAGSGQVGGRDAGVVADGL
jgi:hypothetical protein